MSDNDYTDFFNSLSEEDEPEDITTGHEDDEQQHSRRPSEPQLQQQHVVLPSETTISAAAKRFCDLDPIRNDEGNMVAFGTNGGYTDAVYCGRRHGLPRSARPLVCGPRGGTACPSCQSLLNHKKVELLRRRFPNTGKNHDDDDDDDDDDLTMYLTALRQSGGQFASAARFLRERGVPELEARFALVQDRDATLTAATTFQEEEEQQEGEAFLSRLEATRRVLEREVPKNVLSLAATTARWVATDMDRNKHQDQIGNSFFVAEGQHLMMKPRRQHHIGSRSYHHCPYCGGQLFSRYCGSHVCKHCHLCQGCVESRVAFQCPALENGGHVHHHPLTFGLDRPNAVCDVRDGSDSHALHGACLWTCLVCDFDSCHACMRAAPPAGFDRRAMTSAITTHREGESSTWEEDNANDDANDRNVTVDNFDVETAEREAAARWEGSYRDDASSGRAAVIVGTGVVGATTTVPEQQQPAASHGNGARRSNRDPSLLTEMRLSEEAQAALHRFQQKSDASLPQVTAAADLVQVEDLLHRSRVVNDRLTRKAIYEAIVAGRLDIAGTLLLSQSFAPNMLTSTCTQLGDTGNEDTIVCCVCADKIDERTSPDGAVGCLAGHAMHASCAADLLLGGGQCPTCRHPLFFPRVAEQEVQAAIVMAEAELSRMHRERKKQRQKELTDDLSERGLRVGDVVRVSDDVAECKTLQMNDPRTGGWNEDMAQECGQDFCVIEIIEDEDGSVVAIRVRAVLRPEHRLVPFRPNGMTNRCSQCQHDGPAPETGAKRCVMCGWCERCCLRTAGSYCDSSDPRWNWHPSLVTLVRRAGQAAIGDEACVDKKEAAAKAAETQMVRLRAELAAVKAAREQIKASMDRKIRPLKSSLSRNLSATSGAAVEHLTDSVSPAGWHRARHLLLLAREWGDSDEAKANRASLYAAVRAGDLDSVARTVRRYNARSKMEAAAWSEALAETHEYIVQPIAYFDLRAFPAMDAPKTGYSLGPMTRFVSKQEVLDNRQIMWLQFAETSFRQSQVAGKVIFDGKEPIKIIGARVVRGEHWRYEDQDGGRGNEGTIVTARQPGWVSVQWDNIKPATFRYRVGSDNRFDLNFTKERPPAQGWLCLRPAGPSSPAIATLARSPWRCFSCGDGLVSPRLGKERFRTCKESNLQNGDIVFVAATLEPVRVVKISSGRVYCSFLTEIRDNATRGENGNGSDLNRNLVWYRHEDLVLSKIEQDDHMDDDAVLANGQIRTRRELVLLHERDKDAARKSWDEASKRCSSQSNEKKSEVHDEAVTFASCVQGHLLHARCLQGALIAGKSCPAPCCTEPLWVSRVQRNSEDVDDACCRENGGAEAVALQAAAELTEHAALVATRASSEEEGQTVTEDSGFRVLKMCPACCAGPLFNDNCADMRAHHGQCAVVALRENSDTQCTPNGPFRVPASEIAAKMMQLSDDQTVADLLPRCPGHNVLIMFNGCLSCGHLFTDTRWDFMPKWDPKAKSMLELEERKRKAGGLLAEQVRVEAGLLQLERDALLRHESEIPEGITSQTNPPPAPSIPAYQVNVHQQSSSNSDIFDGLVLDDY